MVADDQQWTSLCLIAAPGEQCKNLFAISHHPQRDSKSGLVPIELEEKRVVLIVFAKQDVPRGLSHGVQISRVLADLTPWQDKDPAKEGPRHSTPHLIRRESCFSSDSFLRLH